MKIVILGGGESGVGAAILAQMKGYEVFLSDMGEIKEKYAAILDEHHIPYESGQHTAARILDTDECIKSPGIPDAAPIIRQLVEHGVPILGELEFAARYTDARFIAITGSNGKTTTTSLIYYIMERAGLNVGLGGNIGKSLAMQVADGEKRDWYVLEVSSFQLDTMYDFHADISVLMNITPDHLDRYEFEFQNYIDSKMRIIQNQMAEDTFVYWQQDDHIDRELEKRSAGYAPCPTPASQPVKPGHPHLCAFHDTDFERLGLEFSQPGQHNKRNALAAYYATLAAGADEDIIRQCLKDFPGVEHRLERVCTANGVLYINDSKATNVDACYVAMQAMETPVVLIVGGTDKGNDYTTLYDIVCQKCRAIVYLGADNAKLHASFDAIAAEHGIATADTHSMEDCVKVCAELAKEGDTVLLSPCCASFDLFQNMGHRGRLFKEFARNLAPSNC